MLTSFIAVDTETTGLDFERDRMIEIAAVRFEDGKPVAEFEALLSPGDRALSPVSRLITGLDPGRLREAPPAAETLRAFAAFAGNLPLVAHNAEFDAHFVRRAQEAEGLAPLPGSWLDSLLMSRIAWPDWDSHKLDTLARRLDLARDGEHRALPDARRAGLVFLEALRITQANTSGDAWRDLSRLATDLPDWSLVFNERGASSPAPGLSGVGSSATEIAAGAASPGETSVEAAREAIAAALDAGGTFAVETPAGVDEHAAGLRAALAAMGRGQRVLLAVPDTAAANALRHILHRDLPAEASRVAILGLPSDYPSRARLSSLAENPARVPPEERAALLPLVAIADRFPGLPVWAGRGFSPDRNRVAWSRARCDGWGDDAAAREARGRAGRADVVIVTHAALCAHVALDGALLPACDVLVATGAHRLPDTALESAGRRVTLFRLRDTLQLMRSSSEHGEGAWADLFPFIADEGREAWKDRWFEPDREFQKFLQKAGRRAEKLRAGGDFRVRYAEHAALAFGADPAPTLDALRANEALLESMASNPEAGNAHRILTRLRDFRKDFEFLCAAHDAGCIYWFEEVANPHKAALRAIPRDMSGFGTAFANLFGGRVFLSPAVLSGADPDAARDARAFLVGAGLLAHADSDESEDAVVEPFEARRIPDDAPQPRFIIASFAPQAGGAEQTEAFARFLSEAAGPHIPKGLLVFCPSQTQLRGLHTALRAVLPQGIPLLAQHIDGNRDAITRLYASERGGWVLATEGLAGLRDADGKAPALWIVSRLPVPPPHDPVLEARGELFRSGREPWRTAAILRVKREWHALRRGGSAPETVWLTDSRAAGEGSGARLARAMGWQAETAKDMEALS